MTKITSTEIARLIGVIISAVIALLTGLGIAVDPTLQDKALELVTAAGTLIATVLTLMEVLRSQVWSKDTAKVLANGVNERNPSQAAKRAAAQVLDQPPPAERSAASWAVELARTVAGMTPGQIDDYILNFGVDAFESAMKILERRPTTDELKAESAKGV